MVGFALPLGQAPALDYPTRTVRVIIDMLGGAPDVLLRMVTQALAEKWGQGGSSSRTARAAIRRLPWWRRPRPSRTASSASLCAADQTFVLNPLLYASLPYSMKELI